MTYTEAIDSLFVMLENACNEIDYMVLVEGANEEGTAESKSKLDKAKKLAKQAWDKICEGIVFVCQHIISFIKDHIKDPLMMKAKIKVKQQMPVSACFVNLTTRGPQIRSAVQAALRGTLIDATIEKALDLVKESSKTVEVPAGELNFVYGEVIKEIERMSGVAAKLSGNPASESNSAAQLLKAYNDLILQLKADLADACDFSSTTRVSEFKAKKAQEAGARYSEREATKRAGERMHPKAESVGLTGNAAYTYASLLIEAANALKASGVIYEDANSTIDLTKQKDIEDIPEETPVVNKEYPENTSGGPGKRDDCLDDIKDLVNGDSKAIDLLTKNDRSKTITESVDDIDLVFDL